MAKSFVKLRSKNDSAFNRMNCMIRRKYSNVLEAEIPKHSKNKWKIYPIVNKRCVFALTLHTNFRHQNLMNAKLQNLYS